MHEKVEITELSLLREETFKLDVDTPIDKNNTVKNV